MSFLSKGRSFAVVTEASYAAAAPVFTNADYVDYTTGDMSTDIEKIERAVIRNSLLKLESVFGQETSSGSIGVEISAATAGALNGDKLYTNGVGKRYAQATATTVASATSSTVFTLTTITGVNVGQVLKVTLGTGNEYVQVAAIAGSEVTVVPALSATPVALDPVEALLTYVLPKPNESVASLAIRENMKPQSGTPIDYDYLGVMVTDASFDYPVGGIATATFSLAGAGFTVDSTGTTPTLPCDIATPVIGKNAVVKVGATSYAAQDVSFSVANEITDINAITTDGITNKVTVGKTVTGSFRVEYTGATEFETYKAGTKASLSLLLRDGGKTSPIIHGAIAPQIKFTNVTKTEDGMLMYTNVEFEVLSPDCGTTERALSVFFDENV